MDCASQLATAEAGDVGVGERLVVAVAAQRAGRGEARVGLVAALDDEHACGRAAGVELVGGICGQVCEAAGGGTYLLEADEHEVAAGDFIYMAPYCPQSFVAGDEGAEYLLYKDVWRDGF